MSSRKVSKTRSIHVCNNKKTLRHSIAGLYPDCSHHRCKGFGLPQKFSRKPQTPHVDQVRWTLRSLQPIQLIVARPCTCLECLEHLLWHVPLMDHNVDGEAERLKCTKNVRNSGALDFHKIWIHHNCLRFELSINQPSSDSCIVRYSLLAFGREVSSVSAR